MRIALAQLNYTIGDIDGNAAKIAEAAGTAARHKARLLVSSELSICGYPPLDLLQQGGFVEACEAAVERLAQETANLGLAILVGHPERRRDGRHSKHLWNSASLLDGGKVIGRVRKKLLPTYNIFDEQRWFAPDEEKATPLVLDGLRLGVHICEDGWNDATFWKPEELLYERDPVKELAEAGAGILINMSASPWSWLRDDVRRAMLAHACKRHGLPGMLVNQVGGHDDLIFDGASVLVNSDGRIPHVAASMREEASVAEAGTGKGGGWAGFSSAARRETMVRSVEETQELRDALELGLRDYVHKTGFKSVLLGLSGGIDSALVAAIACHALGPKNVRCIGMPSEYSSPGSISDSKALCRNLGCAFDVIPISAPYEATLESLRSDFSRSPFGLAEENTQARVRGVFLMGLSNKTGALVMSTGNKSELSVGYSTLYGDMCGALEVIGDLYKTQCYRLARFYNRQGEVIPSAIIEKPPSAELRPNQLDTDSLPPYEVLDPILEAYVDRAESASQIVESGVCSDRALVERIIRMVDRAEYKRRQAPPVLRVSYRAFGRGRQLPIAQRARTWEW